MELKYIALIAVLWLLSNSHFLSMKIVLKIKRARKIWGEFNLLSILYKNLDFLYKKQLNFTSLWSADQNFSLF